MLRVQLSPEVIQNLKSIDAKKADIDKAPMPSPEELEQLERDFILDTVYYGNKLDGSDLSREDTERVLAKAE